MENGVQSKEVHCDHEAELVDVAEVEVDLAEDTAELWAADEVVTALLVLVAAAEVEVTALLVLVAAVEVVVTADEVVLPQDVPMTPNKHHLFSREDPASLRGAALLVPARARKVTTGMRVSTRIL